MMAETARLRQLKGCMPSREPTPWVRALVGASVPEGYKIAFDRGGLPAIECAPFEFYLLNFRYFGYENIFR
jgi:hypothetical protein